jgi:metal-responsive CopG/Arc/MetJ family transcriptional regulator
MGIRTTVTLEQDVLDRVKDESKASGRSFRETLNELLRDALAAKQDRQPRKREFRIDPIHTGARRDLNYDCTEALLEQIEGPFHR